MKRDMFGYPYDPELLPVGMLIPTRNCAPLLEKHLEMLQPLLPHMQEVVVVDSFSNDGTYEILSRKLKHSRLRIHQRPPGLYESWNYGVQQLSAELTYISTIGESIDRIGLLNLLIARAVTQADVVISPPEFRTMNGNVVRDKHWPVHDLLRSRRRWPSSGVGTAKRAVVLDPWQVYLISTLQAPQSLLGSSAANIYSTKALQAHPFPTDYGHFGDSAWTIRHAFDLTWGFLPQMVSTFTLHDSGVEMPIDRIEEYRDKLFDLALKSLIRGTASHPGDTQEVVSLVKQFPTEFRRQRALQERCDVLRKSGGPWILNAEAWKARAARNRQRRLVSRLDSRIRSLAACLAKTSE